MKIGNNGNLVLRPFDESTPCLMIVLMNCQTKLRINHLTVVKSVAILESNANLNFYTWGKKHSLDRKIVRCVPVEQWIGCWTANLKVVERLAAVAEWSESRSRGRHCKVVGSSPGDTEHLPHKENDAC
ncbi:alpha-2 adrenergic receptor [Trichonephila clavipes]|nr:alpha-2 adrenergic receptor [Trichonephila clavipes]